MTERKFLGARIEPEVYDIVNKIVEEEHVNKTKAIKILIFAGWKELRLEKALDNYRKGVISIDKAAEIAGLTANEMMQEAASHGIKSEETLEEFRDGLRLLMEETKPRG